MKTKMKKLTTTTGRSKGGLQPMAEVKADFSRTLSEYVNHPQVQPFSADFVLMLASLMEAETDLKREDVTDADDQQALIELAQAFAAIERHKHLLPEKFYEAFGDWMMTFYSDAEWASDPEIVSLIMPLILRKAKAAEKVRAS